MPTGVYPRRPLADRFWEKVAVQGPDDCWLWLGYKDHNGYGQISVAGRGVGAHRVSFELNKHALPPGLVPDHLCRRPSCVNPDHLEAVTMGENTRRGVLHLVRAAKARQQTHCKRGHPLFGSNLRMGDHGRYCIICQRNAAEVWRAVHRERVNELQRQRRALGGK